MEKLDLLNMTDQHDKYCTTTMVPTRLLVKSPPSLPFHFLSSSHVEDLTNFIMVLSGTDRSSIATRMDWEIVFGLRNRVDTLSDEQIITRGRMMTKALHVSQHYISRN
jgi:hypothetical protein